MAMNDFVYVFPFLVLGFAAAMVLAFKRVGDRMAEAEAEHIAKSAAADKRHR